MMTIQDVQALGFTVGIAHGSVEVEQAALANATADASPQAVTREAGQITAMTLTDLANAGKLPENEADKQALAARIATDALNMVTTHADERVEFHQRALAIAQAMPDVWHVDQTVTVDDGTTTVVSIYVACKADGTGWDDDSQAVLDALAHQPSYDERVFQAQNPDAMQAAQQLASDGATVERDAGADMFIVDGKTFDTTQVIALADAPEAPAK